MNPTNCKNCDSVLPEGAAICPVCGIPAAETTVAIPIADVPVAPLPVVEAFPAAPAPWQPIAPAPLAPDVPYGQPMPFAAPPIPYQAPYAAPTPMPPVPPYGEPSMYPIPSQMPCVKKSFSPFAIISFVPGILGILGTVFTFSPLFSPYILLLTLCIQLCSIVFGGIGSAKFNPRTQHGKGVVIAGLILGILGFAILVFTFITMLMCISYNSL